MKKITAALTVAALILLSLTVLFSCAAKDDSPLIGKWRAAADLADVLSRGGASDVVEEYGALGVDFPKYSLSLVFEFKAGGNLSFSVDRTAADETMEALFGEMIDKNVASSGKSEADYLASLDYESREEAIRDMKKNADFSSFSAEAVKYSFEGDTLTIGDMKFKAALGGGTLTITEQTAKGNEEETLSFMADVLPLTLTKE